MNFVTETLPEGIDEKMKISIITITLNSSMTIEDTIRSVFQQRYSNYEHIIIDGQSTDDTLDKIKNMKTKHIRIYSDIDSGIYDAFNKGLAYATGDVVGFLNSDDTFADSEVLSNIALQFEKCNCDALYGDLIYLSKARNNKVLRYWKSGHVTPKSIRRGWMPPHPTFYFKTDLYNKYGGFNTHFQISGDYEHMLRYLLKYKISVSYIPKVLVKMKLGGKSNGSIKNLILKTNEDFLIMSSYGINPFYGVFMKIGSKLKQYLQR